MSVSRGSFLSIPPGFLLVPWPVAGGAIGRNPSQLPEPPDRQSCGFDVPPEGGAFRVCSRRFPLAREQFVQFAEGPAACHRDTGLFFPFLTLHLDARKGVDHFGSCTLCIHAALLLGIKTLAGAHRSTSSRREQRSS